MLPHNSTVTNFLLPACASNVTFKTSEKEKACDSRMVQALSKQCMKNYFLISLYCCHFPFD